MHYMIKVFYSEEDKGFIALVPDLAGCSAFGETEEEAIKEVKIAQELWLKTAKKEGRKIPQPSSKVIYSGKILARTPKSLHKALMEKANEEGVSLNQLVVYLLSKGVGNQFVQWSAVLGADAMRPRFANARKRGTNRPMARRKT